jgi:hypothetical protein
MKNKLKNTKFNSLIMNSKGPCNFGWWQEKMFLKAKNYSNLLRPKKTISSKNTTFQNTDKSKFAL